MDWASVPEPYAYYPDDEECTYFDEDDHDHFYSDPEFEPECADDRVYKKKLMRKTMEKIQFEHVKHPDMIHGCYV